MTDIVYEDGTSTGGSASETSMTNQKVKVTVTDKQNLNVDYKAGRYSPRVNFNFEVFNQTQKDIKGVSGTLTAKDLFGVDILDIQLDFTGQTIPANGKSVFEDLGIDINEFQDKEVKLYGTNYDDLIFEYEIQSIVYTDGTTE